MVCQDLFCLLLSRPKRLPEFGRATGSTLREFKNSVNEIMVDQEEGKPINQEASQSSDI
ncbi:twin-arginine translocase TatA/TatE family subunit [Anaerobacillus sp. CMMVII]|uniref:twin-arginine translocase TatA/TatE family subunit n=1 Tax=Anaerobacillus sp. CMMVII TaxID=2755588 RepID=UPI0021B79824|nr:twin-arginine translocase TatA/TatE family subunit [Anaerobacillus sp. CMMVII]MCT8136511.1 twin-arginine translocase TatA/TatE family subunit [Anaerobacillus sp. CMMVII]